MSYKYTIEQDLALANLEIVREFDLSSLINNIRIKKDKGKINFVNVNLDKYISFINTSLGAINEITLDRKQVIGFNNFLNVVNDEMISDIQVPEYFSFNILDIKPGYLKEYADNVALVIQRALDNSISTEEIDRFLTDEITKKVKKQMIRTNDTVTLSGMPEVYVTMYDYPVHRININQIYNGNTVSLTKQYIVNNIIPFIEKFPEFKIKAINESKQTIEAITYAHEIINLYFRVINDEMKNADNKKAQKLSYILYNITRTIYEASSFLAFMMVHKNSLLIKDITVCKQVYNAMYKKTAMPTPEVDEFTSESVFDTGVVSNDTNHITADLLSGSVDAYTVLANNIYEYNKGIITNAPESPLNILGDDMHSPFDSIIDEKEYNKTVYEDVIKAFLTLNAGLDIIAANSDDYLMVFDDIISKAGFGTDLNHRFSNVVDAIDIVNEYESAANIAIPGGTPESLYLVMLKEVKDYPENMKKIADTINSVKTKIDYLKDRFDNNINGEYKNAQAINELKVFFDDLKEQMRKLINDIGSKFMLRLKKIALQMNEINDKRETIIDDTNYNEDVLDDVFSFEDIVESYEAITDVIFDRIMTEYTIMREKDLRGIDIVLEADEEQNNTNNQQPQPATNQQPQQNQNTNQNTQTNQQQKPNQETKPLKNNTKNSKLEAFKNKLSSWFDRVIAKLQSIAESAQAKRDKAYIDRNRDALLNKRYATSTSKVEIIDYERFMPASNLTGHLKLLVNKTSIGNLNVNKLNAVNSDSKLIYMIFGDKPPAKVWENENVSQAITTYYKCGVYQEQPVTLKGNELKKSVENAVNFCYDFYGSTLPDIRNSIQKIKNNLDDAASKFVTESLNSIDYGKLFTEADDKEVEKLTNASKKCDIIRKNVEIYCNALLTATFDRYKDYMRLLRSIIADEPQK